MGMETQQRARKSGQATLLSAWTVVLAPTAARKRVRTISWRVAGRLVPHLPAPSVPSPLITPHTAIDPRPKYGMCLASFSARFTASQA